MLGWVLRAVREYKCEHDWELLQKTAVYGRVDYATGEVQDTNMPTQFKQLYRCKKCGAKRLYKT
jgi:hypothetical protein